MGGISRRWGWRSPVLLIHGDDDRNVPFSEALELVEQLRARRVHVEHLAFPDEVHGFLPNRSWRRTFSEAADFLDRHLAPRRAPNDPRWPGRHDRDNISR